MAATTCGCGVGIGVVVVVSAAATVAAEGAGEGAPVASIAAGEAEDSELAVDVVALSGGCSSLP